MSTPINSDVYIVKDYKQQLSDHLYLSHYTKIISRLNLEMPIIGFVQRNHMKKLFSITSIAFHIWYKSIQLQAIFFLKENWDTHKYKFRCYYSPLTWSQVSFTASTSFPSPRTRIIHALLPARFKIKDQFSLGYIHSYKEIRRVFSSSYVTLSDRQKLNKKFQQKGKASGTFSFCVTWYESLRYFWL